VRRRFAAWLSAAFLAFAWSVPLQGQASREAFEQAMVPFVGIGSWLSKDLLVPGVQRRSRYVAGLNFQVGVRRFRLATYAALSRRTESCPDNCPPSGAFFGLALERPFFPASAVVRPFIGGGLGAFDLGFTYVSPDLRAGVEVGGRSRIGFRAELRHQWLLGVSGPDPRMLLVGVRIRS
jgi:hypothetical protein